MACSLWNESVGQALSKHCSFVRKETETVSTTLYITYTNRSICCLFLFDMRHTYNPVCKMTSAGYYIYPISACISRFLRNKSYPSNMIQLAHRNRNKWLELQLAISSCSFFRSHRKKCNVDGRNARNKHSQTRCILANTLPPRSRHMVQVIFFSASNKIPMRLSIYEECSTSGALNVNLKFI